MGVVALKSNVITKQDTAPNPIMLGTHEAYGYKEAVVGYASKAADDSATSTYRMVRVHSSWRLSSLIVAIGALGTSGTINVGVYQVPANGGAFVNKTLFASALDASAKLRSELVIDAANGDDMTEKLWQRLGLTEDSNRFYDIVVELQHAGAGNAVKIAAEVEYQR